MGETRTLRDRHRALEEILDRAKSDRPPFVAARRLVQVFEEVTLPTTADVLYACHPCEIDSDETEGASVAVIPDTSVTMYVDVIGQLPPVAGQNLIAVAVGGRWVAEMTDVSPCDGTLCKPCEVPLRTLNVLHATGRTGVMSYDGCTAGVASWSGCIAPFSGTSVRLRLVCKKTCSYFIADSFSDITCFTNDGFGNVQWETTSGCSGIGGAVNHYTLVSVCSTPGPFSLKFSTTVGGLVWTIT